MSPEPLFHDPYAACIAALKGSQQQSSSAELKDDGIGCYELATRFIDDSLLKGVGDLSNPVRQVLLFCDDGASCPLMILRWYIEFTVEVDGAKTVTLNTENIPLLYFLRTLETILVRN